MRIAYLTPQYPKVSHTFIRREVLALERRGYEVERISIRPSDAGVVVDAADRAELDRTTVLLREPLRLVGSFLGSMLRSPLKTLAIGFEVVGTGLATGSGLVRSLAYLIEAAGLVELCRRRQVEHVHVHFGTNAATVAWIAHRLGGLRFSMTIHGPDEWDAPERHRLPEKLADAAFTVLVSSYGRAQAMRWVSPAHFDRLEVVHCTVDDAFFEDVEPIDALAPLEFVCVGRLTPQKGPLLLLEAFARVRESFPEARLVLAGDGELRAIVEERIAALGLTGCIEITGWVDESQVRAALDRARVLVLPSFAEGLPVVIMEALARQRPVLSTYVAGIPELVRPDENGWLVPPGDVAALSDALVRIASTPVSELRKMGAAGAERVRAEHAVENEAARLDRLLRAAAER